MRQMPSSTLSWNCTVYTTPVPPDVQVNCEPAPFSARPVSWNDLIVWPRAARTANAAMIIKPQQKITLVRFTTAIAKNWDNAKKSRLDFLLLNSASGGCFLQQSILLQLVLQRAPTDAQGLGRLLPVAGHVSQRLANQHAFHFRQRRP